MSLFQKKFVNTAESWKWNAKIQEFMLQTCYSFNKY